MAKNNPFSVVGTLSKLSSVPSSVHRGDLKISVTLELQVSPAAHEEIFAKIFPMWNTEVICSLTPVQGQLEFEEEK